jgi:hypothetical protein
MLFDRAHGSLQISESERFISDEVLDVWMVGFPPILFAQRTADVLLSFFGNELRIADFPTLSDGWSYYSLTISQSFGQAICISRCFAYWFFLHHDFNSLVSLYQRSMDISTGIAEIVIASFTRDSTPKWFELIGNYQDPKFVASTLDTLILRIRGFAPRFFEMENFQWDKYWQLMSDGPRRVVFHFVRPDVFIKLKFSDEPRVATKLLQSAVSEGRWIRGFYWSVKHGLDFCQVVSRNSDLCALSFTRLLEKIGTEAQPWKAMPDFNVTMNFMGSALQSHSFGTLALAVWTIAENDRKVVSLLSIDDDVAAVARSYVSDFPDNSNAVFLKSVLDLVS